MEKKLILQTKNLSKKYGEKLVLDGINMNIYEGDIYGFVGKNGSGKTTLMRIVCGLAKSFGGEISLFSSKDSSELYENMKNLGALIEKPSLYMNLTAYENLKLQAMLGSNIEDKRISEVLEIVGLNNEFDLKKKVKDFSLGMRQRLGIGMAIITKPKLLILDEPINGLDPNGILEVRNLLIKLNKEENVTILISSHILTELSKLATRFGILHEGKLVKEFDEDELENLTKANVVFMLSEKIEPYIDKLNLTNYECFNYKLTVYDKFDLNDLILKLNELGIKVLDFEQNKADIEKYFIDVTRG